MTGYVLSPEAEEDIFRIWRYLVTEASIEVANRVESELFADFELLARNPGIGHKRQDLTKVPILFYRAHPYEYMVIYRRRTPLEIVGLLHARRNIKTILKQRLQS